MAKKQTWQQVYADMQKEEEEQKWWQGWFQKGAFADGYDFGDITKTYLGLRADLSQNVFSAVLDATENLVDTVAYGVGAFGNKNFKEKVGNFIAKDIFKHDETAKWIYDHIPYDALGVNVWSKYVIGDDVEQSSLLNEKADSLVQSVAHQVGSRALNLVGVPWQLTTGVNSFGSETEEAFGKDAGFWEAGVSGLITSAAEIGAESLFSGSTTGEKGLVNLDNLTSGIKNKALKAIADWGWDMAKEGAEEMASNFASSLGQAIYESDNPQEYWQVVLEKNTFDELMSAFVSGAAMSGMGNFTNAASSVVNKTDYRTGLTAQEQSVFDSVYEGKVKDYVAENGKKPIGKAKKKIFTDTLNELNTGRVSTDAVASVLAPETQKKYQAVTAELSELQQEYEQLYNMKDGEKTDAQRDRQADLKAEIEDLKAEQQELDSRMEALAKGTRMEESYRERARKGEKFQADPQQYSNSSASQTVRNIVESGVVNNTRRSHEFVSMMAKISEDTGLVFSTTDAKRLKETGLSVDGAVVNGYYTENGVAININSPKALETVVGHEVAHALEGTAFAEPLKQAVVSYAKSKGEYNSLMESLSKLYSGKPGYETDFQSKMEKELVADLIGKYLFNDADFVRSLSVQNRNLFQRLLDEIKYLLRIAKAGSKEAKQLEKIKKLFEEAYRDAKNTASNEDGVKYSISTTEDGIKYVKLDGNIFVDQNGKELTPTQAYNAIVGLKLTLEDGDVITFIKKLPNRNIYKELFRKIPGYEPGIDVKAISESINKNILDVVSASTAQTRNEEQKHPHIGIKSFDTRSVYLYDGNDAYRLEINIANLTDNTKIAYVKRFIEKADRSILAKIQKAETAGKTRLNQPSKYSIVENDQNVNHKLSLSEEIEVDQADGKNTHTEDVAVVKTEPSLPADVQQQITKLASQLQEAVQAGDMEAAANLGKKIYDFKKTQKKTAAETTPETKTDNDSNTEKPLEEMPATERPKRILTAAGLRRAKLHDLETEYNNSLSHREIAREQFDEAIKTAQNTYSQKKNKNTKVANKLLAKIENLQKRKADIDAYWEKKAHDLQQKIYKEKQKQAKTPESEETGDMTEVSAEIAEKAEKLTGNKDTFVTRRASELYKEINTLTKGSGIRASSALDYLLNSLDNPKDWNPLKTALLNIRDNPNEIVNEKSRIELLARDTLEAEYRAKEMDWIDILSPSETSKTNIDSSAEINKEIKAIAEKVISNMEQRDRMRNSQDDYIAVLQKRYDQMADKQSSEAMQLAEDIQKQQEDNKDAIDNIQQRIDGAVDRIERMMSPEYRTAKQKEFMHDQYQEWAAELLGNTTTWVDKKTGLQYMTNTLRRNLHDIVRDENGKPDPARADAIYEELQGTYNTHEAALNRELTALRAKYAALKITKAEDTYIQMLGEFRHNPATTLSLETVEDFYNKNKSKIDQKKVDKIIEMARKDYDDLIQRVNEVLRKQGMKEIPYRKGYFPHFTRDPQGPLAKLLNWKIKNDDIPTDIAGLTETFEPDRSYQSFNKKRTSDITDYSFMLGFDQYSFGALDWIYHIEDIQKRRAVENYIRYTHSSEGVKEKVAAIKNNETIDADEMQKQIDAVYAEAKNPLNNFVIDLRKGTQKLAGKKSPLDREIEYATNRKIYSVMTNISNRVSANMVAGSFSAALTNFIPITQSWAVVNPLRSAQAMAQVIRNTIWNDGMVEKSDFLTNRLRQAENLYKTGWDKVSDKISFFMNLVDNFSAQTVWRSKYNQNISKGMSEAEAIHDADLFAESVLAGRSRGNMPTIFDAKNPVVKMLTAFQLEVANQYGYLFKDAPRYQQNKNKAKLRLIGNYTMAFAGAYVLNCLYKAVLGRAVAFDPFRIIQELLGDIKDESEKEKEDRKWSTVVLNSAENVAQEVPFIGGLLGGGRVPISSALPYDGIVAAFKESAKDIDKIGDGGFKALTKEWLNPVYYGLMPMGGGQLKKTIEGLSMYTGDKPVSGSYTTDGNLRFSVEPTVGNVAQSALFGQWASDEAQQYIDEGRKPLSEKQTKEFVELDIPIQQYWQIRDGLNRIDKSDSKTKQADKVDYINSLNLSVDQKNTLVNNILNRKEKVDLTDYDKFGSWAEFDLYIKQPEKYSFLKQNGISYADYAHDKDAYNWAYQNPGKYTVSKAFLLDTTQYYACLKSIAAIEADKDKLGRSIDGTLMAKRAKYIGSLPITKIEKALLMKQYYSSFDDADTAIIQFIAESDSLSRQEKVVILFELGLLPDDLNLLSAIGGSQ